MTVAQPLYVVAHVHTTIFTVCEYELSLIPSEQVCAVIVAWIFVPLRSIVDHDVVVVTVYDIDHIVPSSFGWFQISVFPDALKFQNGSVPSACILCATGAVGVGIGVGVGICASSPVGGVGVGSSGVVLTHHTRNSTTKLTKRSMYFMEIGKIKHLYAILSVLNCKHHLQFFWKRVWKDCFLLIFFRYEQSCMESACHNESMVCAYWYYCFFNYWNDLVWACIVWDIVWKIAWYGYE